MKDKTPEIIDIPKTKRTFIVLLVSKIKTSRLRIVNHETKPQRIELTKIRLKLKSISFHPSPSTLRTNNQKSPIHWIKLPIEALIARPTIPREVKWTKK